eukprot:SM000267S09856  [mRNA]  locus=s267:34652:35240:+ [translate_table: standard]
MEGEHGTLLAPQLWSPAPPCPVSDMFSRSVQRSCKILAQSEQHAPADSEPHNRAAGICNLFEKRLIEQLPSVHNITYGTDDLLEFLDSLVDITALVYVHSLNHPNLDPSTLKYTPFDRQWIKQRALEHLQMQSRPDR